MNRNPRRINRINRALVRTAAIVSISALGAAGGVTIARADTVLAVEGLMQRPGKTATAFGGAFCQHGCRSVNNPTSLLTGFTNQARGADRIEAEVAAALADPTTGTVTVIGWSLGAASIDTTEDRWQANPESAPAPGRVRLVTFGRPNDRDDDRQTAAPEYRIERLDVVMQYDKIADKPDRFGFYSWLNSAMAGSRHFDYFTADINDPTNLVYRDGQTTHMLIEADVLPLLRWRDWFTPDDRMAELDAKYRPLVEADYDRPAYVEQGPGADWGNGVEPETLRDNEEESWSERSTESGSVEPEPAAGGMSSALMDGESTSTAARTRSHSSPNRSTTKPSGDDSESESTEVEPSEKDSESKPSTALSSDSEPNTASTSPDDDQDDDTAASEGGEDE